MANRKQRRRRQKLQRHEYEFVVETEDGEEIPLDELREREGGEPAGKRGRDPELVDRRGRPVQKPSLQKVFRRAAIFAPVLFAFVYLTSRDRLSVVGVVLNTLILVAFFIPFSYLVDTMVYRLVMRRHERGRGR
jgi:hypothetical protein